MSRALHTVVALSGHRLRMQSLDAALLDVSDYDVIVLESIARGYSRIKQLTPDLVMVFLEIDDVAACQLLSMLKVDGDLSRIPVVTYMTRRENREDIIAEPERDSSGQTLALPMN